MEIKRSGQAVADARRSENIAAAQAKGDAMLEYVAMMADVEIPYDEGEESPMGEGAVYMATVKLSAYAKKVQTFYLNGFWSASMVGDALEKGRITKKEHDAILASKES